MRCGGPICFGGPMCCGDTMSCGDMHCGPMRCVAATPCAADAPCASADKEEHGVRHRWVNIRPASALTFAPSAMVKVTSSKTC